MPHRLHVVIPDDERGEAIYFSCLPRFVMSQHPTDLPKRKAISVLVNHIQAALCDENLPIYLFMASVVAAMMVMLYMALTL